VGGRRNECSVENQPIGTVDAGRLVGNPGSIQRGEQKVATSVSREHSASAIGPMSGRGESEDQMLRVRIAEVWNRASPVVVVGK
jgi:hypothetical protein